LGKVVSVSQNIVSVKLETSSLCASCHAKGACSAADKADKVVEVKVTNSNVYSVGEEVTVLMEKSLGLRAVLISYVIPLIILLFLLLTLSMLGCNELVAGLFSILGVGIYFAVLFVMRDSIEQSFVFRIEKS
jgi:Positive regulator of sigma E activity